jgi:glycosyltransferase involved in cell wall biosynthesis
MPIKVLHITSNRDGNIGGAEKLLLDLHERFDPADFQFFYANVLSLGKSDDPYIQALRDAGYDFVNLTAKGKLAAALTIWELSKLIRLQRPNIIHTHLLHASFLGQLAGRVWSDATRVVTRHYTNDVFRGSRMVRSMDKWAMKMAEHVVAVSDAVKRDILTQGMAESKVSVIHNGVEISSFEDGQNTTQKRDGSPFEIVTVGSLTDRKGHQYLLQGVYEVTLRTRAIRLRIVGDGPERDGLERLTSTLGLNDVVEFMGFQEDVAAFIKNSDIYVHPAVYEPFGIAVIEAMACGKCVIATKTGGIPEIVVDGITGHLVPPRNPVALAEAIIWAINNTKTIEKMGGSGRERAIRCFDLALTAAQYHNLYIESVRSR